MLPRLDRLKVYAGVRAPAPTGAPSSQPRTFKPKPADLQEELDNFANDIERPQNLTPGQVQQMIRKGELPPPSKRPQARLPPRPKPPPNEEKKPSDDDDDDSEPPSWEELDAEMQRTLKLYEARDKEAAERRKRLLGQRGGASTGESRTIFPYDPKQAQ